MLRSCWEWRCLSSSRPTSDLLREQRGEAWTAGAGDAHTTTPSLPQLPMAAPAKRKAELPPGVVVEGDVEVIPLGAGQEVGRSCIIVR